MNSIELTPNAAKRISFLAQKDSDSALFLRLTVDSGGCSGFQYKFQLDSQLNADDDLVIERDGAKLVVDKTSSGFLIGAQVDFVSDLSGEMFQIKNPIADSSCGCGTSFSIKM
jgi:iron-sulfur cluster insertion protein